MTQTRLTLPGAGIMKWTQRQVKAVGAEQEKKKELAVICMMHTSMWLQAGQLTTVRGLVVTSLSQGRRMMMARSITSITKSLMRVTCAKGWRSWVRSVLCVVLFRASAPPVRTHPHPRLHTPMHTRAFGGKGLYAAAARQPKFHPEDNFFALLLRRFRPSISNLENTKKSLFVMFDTSLGDALSQWGAD